ncbi:glycosyltransferase family 2 protein [Gammaproteobacteria bacterium]|nr:glycosyltransferase family 2 protein [Gammaproteobacteria bacterium]
MKLSIVATLYQSAAYVDEFYARAVKVARELVGDDYELIFVNDDSPDASLELAIELHTKDPRVIVVDLSRNFGHHKAIMTGLAQALGERVFLIDSDLEEEPEWLSSFADQMTEEKCDVVFGVQNIRKGGWFERFSGWLFYLFYSALTGFDFPKNLVTARLMTRRYVKALLLHNEREVSLGGLYYITGFNQKSQVIKKHNKSDSTYTLRRKISLLVNSVVSFTSKPLVAIFFLGILLFTLSAAISFYFIFNALFLGNPPDGWTSLLVSVWALGGIIISCIGVLGIYISKIYIETKRRPYTIIRQVYGDPLRD